MSPHASNKSSPRVSLFDIFIGSGRTIRKPKGPPGVRHTIIPRDPDLPHYVAISLLQPVSYLHWPLVQLPLLQTNWSPQKTSHKETNGTTKQGHRNQNGKDSADATKDAPTTGEATTFTPAQDAALLALKAENKSWKDIGIELGKPAWALKARFKEITPADSNPAAKVEAGKVKAAANKEKAGGKGKGQDEGKSGGNARTPAEKAAEGRAKAAANKANQGKKQMPKDDLGTAKGKDKGGEETTFSLAEWITLSEDEQFSFQELQELGRILAGDEQSRWRRVASLFYDRTGRRLDEEDIRSKFRALDGL